MAEKEGKDHRHGHRGRMRKRVLTKGVDSLADYEVLEMLLYYTIPYKDTKEVAKKLLKRYGSLPKVIHADQTDLLNQKSIGESAAVLFALISRLRQHIAKDKATEKSVLSSWESVIEYCRAQIGFGARETFAILHLNSKNKIINTTTLAEGTVNRVNAYPREIVKHALENNAAAVILAHNHPSGDTEPSPQDISVTRAIHKALESVDIALHDHLIISPTEYTSFKDKGLL